MGLNSELANFIECPPDRDSALRTWWTLYSLESELCLEYGRPLCIRERDAKVSYPQETLVSTSIWLLGYCSNLTSTAGIQSWCKSYQLHRIDGETQPNYSKSHRLGKWPVRIPSPSVLTL